MLDCWLYWFLHAHEYEADALLEVISAAADPAGDANDRPQSQVAEAKRWTDAREKAIRDHQWAMNSARREGLSEGRNEGKIEGKIEGKEIEGKIENMIRTLQSILNIPVSEDQVLRAMDLPQLESLANDLQGQIRNRTSS